MLVYRLSRAMFASPLSGKGAALRGGRWNSQGVELLYTAENRSLAMAEVAVHFTFATCPSDYVLITIEIPDKCAIGTIDESLLPNNWRSFPHPPSTQKFGDDFVKQSKLVAIKIPSVITQGDYNILINPQHPDFKKINILKIEPFPFDKRMLK